MNGIVNTRRILNCDNNTRREDTRCMQDGQDKISSVFIVPTLMLFICVWEYAQAEKLSPIDVSRLHEAISCDD